MEANELDRKQDKIESRMGKIQDMYERADRMECYEYSRGCNPQRAVWDRAIADHP